MHHCKHAFSVDVEDWYQSSYDFNSPISDLCVENTRHVLKFLGEFGVRGTFFVQGMVAKYFPLLVKEIAAGGHEVQSHGYSHRPVYSLTWQQFRQEMTETSNRIEDITGSQITGYRAPDFSIGKNTFWAFEIMLECGIRYDSSIFPLETSRYGISGFNRGRSVIQTPSGVIEELPVTVLELPTLRGMRVPVGGGGYFRLLPGWFLRYCLRTIEKEQLPFVLYCHPYEFNPGEWRQMKKYVPVYRRLHQGLGRNGFETKVAALISMNSFGTMSDVLKIRRQKADD